MNFDLVDEMMWEDLTDFVSLEDAGLEDRTFDTVPACLSREYFSGEQ